MDNTCLTLKGQRIRGAGVIVDKFNRILMVENLHRLSGERWLSLPGGGLNSGESLKEAVLREVREECNIDCVVKDILYIREFVDEYTCLHNLEVFFLLEITEGKPTVGYNPEGEIEITYAGFMEKEEIMAYNFNVYPELLLDKFWLDLENNFINRQIYLGFHWPTKGSGVVEKN